MDKYDEESAKSRTLNSFPEQQRQNVKIVSVKAIRGC